MTKWGSDDARAWARRLHFGDVRAKSVLNAICNYVGEDGAAHVSIPTLAEDTDQSADSVRNRLKRLEKYGVLVRFARWIDDNGHINGEKRGRCTADELRLALGVDHASLQAKINEERASEKASPSEKMDDAEAADPLQQGSDPGQQQGSTETPTLATGKGQTLATSKGILSKESKEDSPQAPQAGGRASDSPILEADGWVAFDAAFSADGIPDARPSIARQIWAVLSDIERQAVTRSAIGYVAFRKAEKKPSTKVSARTFLRERDNWERWAKFAPAPPSAGPAFVAAGEPLFAALSVVNRIRVGKPLEAITVFGRDGRGVLTRAEPRADLMTLAAFAESNGAWLELEADDNARQIAAWRERIKAWTGQSLETRRAPALDASGKQIVKTVDGMGRKYEMPQWREVVIVPCEWPPRKDGTITTGPPEPQSTAGLSPADRDFAAEGAR